VPAALEAREPIASREIIELPHSTDADQVLAALAAEVGKSISLPLEPATTRHSVETLAGQVAPVKVPAKTLLVTVRRGGRSEIVTI